jgi:acetolactate synthase-1/3 small subunit
MLDVNDHPGVLSHITGLFTRRGFNLEAVMCGRLGAEGKSRIYLLVKNDDRLEQVIKQLQKLYDVSYVAVCDNCNTKVFDNVSKIIGDSQWMD